MAVTATLVAKQHARGSEEGVQEAVSQALVLGTFVALFGMTFILVQPDRLLGGVLSGKVVHLLWKCCLYKSNDIPLGLN